MNVHLLPTQDFTLGIIRLQQLFLLLPIFMLALLNWFL